MFASFKTDRVCRGTQVLVADQPEGPFIPHSNGPVTPRSWECLDGSFFIDPAGNPWLIFCHEWLQTYDGEICALRLSEDLKTPAGWPQVLFSSSQAPWVQLYTLVSNGGNEIKSGYVTDGPFLYTLKNKTLLMLWSSFGEEGYAIGVSKSKAGKVVGPWEHNKEPLFKKDGGHAMIFRTFEGNLMLTMHAPNVPPMERPHFFKMEEIEENIRLMGEK